MNDYDQHLILHHLDDPLRILHWTIDEAAVIMLPAFFGLGVGGDRLWGSSLRVDVSGASRTSRNGLA